MLSMTGTTSGLRARILGFAKEADELELEQKALARTRENLEASIREKKDNTDKLAIELDKASNALAILRRISDDAVQQSYKFIMDNINAALERIFTKSKRSIQLREYTRAGAYPQLEIELITENGAKRSLKDDSGHGIAQIVSLMCELCLIVITGGRRILIIDETLSGLSAKSRRIIDDILWAFTDIGFQFIVSEHGYIPRGSKVYHLEMRSGVSQVVDEYIAGGGTYLNNSIGRNEVVMQDGVVSEQTVSEEILDII